MEDPKIRESFKELSTYPLSEIFRAMRTGRNHVDRLILTGLADLIEGDGAADFAVRLAMVEARKRGPSVRPGTPADVGL